MTSETTQRAAVWGTGGGVTVAPIASRERLRLRCRSPVEADAGRCYVARVGTSVEVPVLVVGGGPVGLLTAVGLRHFGVDCLVIEKHASTLDFPKGRRVTTRTVEILRQWGLEEAVAEVSLPPAASLFVFEGETLLGDEFVRRSLPYDEAKPTSPTRELICSQENLEPVLRNRAVADADVRFSAELVGFTQDGNGATASVVMSGELVSGRASYMVAADGGAGTHPGGVGHRQERSRRPGAPAQHPG